MDAPPRLESHAPAPSSREPCVSLTAWKSVELVQRGRIILDVSEMDLAATEARLGAFHETTWFFRHQLADARRAWERLRAEYGTRALEAALLEPPQAIVPLGDATA